MKASNLVFGRVGRALTAAAACAVLGCDSDDDELRRQLAEDCATPLGELARAKSDLAAVPGSVVLEVPFLFGKQPLELETGYASPLGTVAFRSLRYWLSNVTLVRPDGARAAIPNSYYLMEVRKVRADKNDKSFDAPKVVQRREVIDIHGVPAGKYDRIEFDVGVDAEHNDDLSIPGGELNVLGNMAVAGWMWFTSYIFTSTFVELTPPGQSEQEPWLVSWENGTNEDLRRVALAIDGGVSVGREHHETVRIPMNADMLFANRTGVTGADGQVLLSIDSSNAAGRAALAENWRKAFPSAAIQR